MSENSGHAAITVLTVLAYLAGVVHFESAVGALIGSFFFLTMPDRVKGLRGLLLWIVSLGFGYATGIYFARSGNEAAAMIVSALIGALAVTIVTALEKYLNGGPMPDFLTRILDRIPFLNKNKGSGDV